MKTWIIKISIFLVLCAIASGMVVWLCPGILEMRIASVCVGIGCMSLTYGIMKILKL
jgi:hypothetical protein